jgi:hypothetical protein
MKENYFLDDGAYLVSKLLIELAQSKLEGKSLPDLIATLKEPEESEEFRLKIGVTDFKAYGHEVIEKLQIFVSKQSDWTVVPNNYEVCVYPAVHQWKMDGFCCAYRFMTRCCL